MDDELLKCPLCGIQGEPSEFPDLFYDSNEYKEQYKLQLTLQSLGFNIVTCGYCGGVLIQAL